MTILYVIFGLLAIGVIIFIHEAGHFLAAKKVGVRVDRFALGFDPPIRGRHLRFFAKKWGETEYVIGMIPFGGYVKLAGEIPEDGTPLAEDELLAKSVGARALVFSAGALMNFLSAFVFFLIAFAFGVGFPEPRVGSVAVGSPAWTGGLRPGDWVVSIDGEEIVDYTELLVASAFAGPEKTLRLDVDRPSSDGKSRERVAIDVTTEWDAARGHSTIGVLPSTGLTLLDDPEEGTAAHDAGFRAGDTIVGASIAGLDVPEVSDQVLIGAIQRHGQIFPGRPMRLRVRRADSSEEWLDFAAKEDPDAEQSTALRVLSAPSGQVIRALAPGAELDEFFDPNDEVLSVQSQPVEVFDWSDIGVRFRELELEFELRRPNGTTRRVSVPRETLLRGLLEDEVHWGSFNASIADIAADAPLAKAGLLAGDAIASVGSTLVFESDRIAEALGNADGPTVACSIVRAGERVSIDLARSDLRAAVGVTWRSFSPLLSVDPDGPAGKAGITAGSRILSLDGETILTFADLVAATQEFEVGDRVAVAWSTPRGETREATLHIGATAYMNNSGLALRTPERIVQGNVFESFQLGVDRSVIVVKQVFLTLRSLIRRDVSPKNLSGPVGITHLFTRVAEMGWIKLLFWMAVISVNLGVVNLLPFPILDGGHLCFLLIEKIKGSPVSFGVQEWATRVAFLLIIGLALFVTYHDVARLIFR